MVTLPSVWKGSKKRVSAFFDRTVTFVESTLLTTRVSKAGLANLHEPMSSSIAHHTAPATWSPSSPLLGISWGSSPFVLSDLLFNFLLPKGNFHRLGRATTGSISCVPLSPQPRFCSLPQFWSLFCSLVYQTMFRLAVASTVRSAVERSVWSGWAHLELPENGVHLFSKSVAKGVPFFTQIFHLVTANPFLCLQSLNGDSNQNCSCYTVFQLINFYKSLYPRGNSRCCVGISSVSEAVSFSLMCAIKTFILHVQKGKK